MHPDIEEMLCNSKRLIAEMEAEAAKREKEARATAEWAERVTGFWNRQYDPAGDFGRAHYSQSWATPPPRTRSGPSPHLAALGLSAGYSQADLKAAYRKRARETHPDAGGSAEEFRKVQAAYEALSRG